MYEKIGYSCALLLTGGLSGADIRKRQIPVNALVLSGIAVIIYLLAGESMSINDLMKNMFPGMVLFLLSMLTKESIGYGDGAVVLLLGLWCGGFFAAVAVGLAILLTGFYAIVLLLRKRSQTIPFLPFLLIAMEVMFLYE